MDIKGFFFFSFVIFQSSHSNSMFIESQEPLTPAHSLPISWRVFTLSPWSAPKLFGLTLSCQNPPLSNDIWFVANERMKYD